MNFIYIDDERLNHLRFERELAMLAQRHFCAYFERASDALQSCKNKRPDLAFVDIEMPEQDGLSLARELQALQIPFVFLTNYNDKAHEAYQLEALHYFTKPISAPKIEEAIRRLEAADTRSILQTLQNKIHQTISTAFRNNEDKYNQVLVVKNRNKVSFLEPSSVIYLEGSGSYTNIYTASGEKHIASKLLRTYEERLQTHPDFIRIHKSYIVNRSYIRSVCYDDYKSWIVLTNNSKLELSDRLRTNIVELISQK